VRISLGVVAISCGFLLAGCASNPVTNTTQVSSDQATKLQGKVYGGQQPLVGASVYLYAANTTGYGSGSISLLGGAGYVTTGAGGAFSITSDYTCPSPSTQVYLYALGGDSGSGANSAAGLLAGLGSCGNLTPSTFVMVNEVSTIATAYAIAGYATDATHVSSAGNTIGQTGIANAFAAIPNLETLATGVALATTPAGNGTVPQSEINTLADILAACVNSTGPSSTACSTLFNNARNGSTAPADTATAAINIAHNPGANIATLYALEPGAGAPFQPTLGSAPNDFTVAFSYSGGSLNQPGGIAIDALGNIWVPNSGAASISEFSPIGHVLGTFTGGGLNGPFVAAIDQSGNVWASNSGASSISEFNSSGIAISGTNGFTGGGLSANAGLAIDALNHVWATSNATNTLSEFDSYGSPLSASGITTGGLNSPLYIALDAGGNLWVANIGSSGSLSEFNSSGVANSNSPYAGGGLSNPRGLAVDSANNIWIANKGSGVLSEFNAAGPVSSSGYSGGGLNGSTFVAIDGSGNLWIANKNGNSISEFNSTGTAVSPATGYLASLNVPNSLAIDGSGNIWVDNQGNGTLTEFVGVATPVVTPLVANLVPPFGSHAVNPPYNNVLGLPTPNPPSLGSATVGQAYSGSIVAVGGVGPIYHWTVNGMGIAQAGLCVSLNDNLSACTNDDATLTISGTPTTTTTVSFNVSVTDTTTNITAGTFTYTITVNGNGGQINGQVSLVNNCGSSTLPTFTVTLTNTATNSTITGTTNSYGQFTFNNVPAATYNITPSISGAAGSIFSPTVINNVQVINGANLNGENFNAAVTYTVSGNASYSGTQTGQTYLSLQGSGYCGSNLGNSITSATLASGGAYTIHGVPPGSYTLNAWMDSTGIASGTIGYPGMQGEQNTNNPTGTTSNVNVTNASVTNGNVTLSNPSYVTPATNPDIQVIPTVGGVLIFYNPPTVNTSHGRVEAANEYVVNWAQASSNDSAGPYCPLGGGTGGAQFLNLAGSHTFYADGTDSTVWILNNTSMGAGSFTSGGTYCFQARAFNTLATTTHPSGWTTPTDSVGNPQGVTLLTSPTFCASNCTTVSGAVTIPAGVSLSAGAPLYVGVFQQSANGHGPSALYAEEIASPASGANIYPSLTVPNGSGYVLFGIFDENNDGAIDAGDVTNVRYNDSAGDTFSGGTAFENLTLPGINTSAQVLTDYSYMTDCQTGCTYYTISLDLDQQNKLPVAVTLSNTSVATPYLLTPVDLSLCVDCGGGQFQYSAPVPGGAPGVGDSFDFTVTYSDGSQDNGTIVNGAVTAFGNTGAVAGASDVVTNMQTTAGTTPNFTWDFPANPGDYTYKFSLNQINCSGSCAPIWQIPSDSSNSNGFTYAQSQTSATKGQITWGVDPTGDSSNAPTGSLNPANSYYWIITVYDSNRNSAHSSANDNNP